MGCRGCELSVLLVDDPQIRQMNRSYRGIDRPTNVLAFGMGQGTPAGEQPRVLGDVAVSVETASRECSQWGHRVQPHVLYLALHGLLHLLGYDDEGSVRRARQMNAVLEELFLACGCAQGSL